MFKPWTIPQRLLYFKSYKYMMYSRGTTYKTYLLYIFPYQKCVRQNLGIAEMKKVNDASSWSCYVCEPKQLWGYRGMFATISQLLTDFRT